MPSAPSRQRGCDSRQNGGGWRHALWGLIVAVMVVGTAAGQAVPWEQERVTIRVEGRPVFRVGATDDASAPERAARVERRIARLLERPDAVAPARIEVSGDAGEVRTISVAGVPVVTVTRQDAEDNLVPVQPLADQWAAALDAALGRARDARARPTGRFGAEVESSVRTAFSRLGESAVVIIPRLLAAALVLALFWAIAAGMRWVMRIIFCRFIDDRTVENLIKQVAYYAVWAVGLMVAFDALGFEAETVIAGLGLTGLALGFALKDILSNFVSGILILASRPFKVGDQIVVGDTEGSVVRIMLRATQIRTYDGRAVLVPNAEVFTGRITNNTAAPVRRGNVLLYVGYGEDLPAALDVVRDATARAEGVLPDPPASVRVRDLTENDILLEARYWADSRRTDFMDTASAVRRSIIAALKSAGIGLPDPAVRVVVPRQPEAVSTRQAPDRAGRGDLTGSR
jgi:small conductance mechanosensitive channel